MVDFMMLFNVLESSFFCVVSVEKLQGTEFLKKLGLRTDTRHHIIANTKLRAAALKFIITKMIDI